MQERRPEMMRRVFEHDAEIFEVKAVAQRAFDAHVGGNANEDEIANAPCPQHGVELRIEEGAIASLVKADVAGLRLEFVDQRIIPPAAGEQLPLQLWLPPHCLEGVRLVPIG